MFSNSSFIAIPPSATPGAQQLQCSGSCRQPETIPGAKQMPPDCRATRTAPTLPLRHAWEMANHGNQWGEGRDLSAARWRICKCLVERKWVSRSRNCGCVRLGEHGHSSSFRLRNLLNNSARVPSYRPSSTLASCSRRLAPSRSRRRVLVHTYSAASAATGTAPCKSRGRHTSCP